MKKILVTAISAVAIAIGAGYGYYHPEADLNDLEFANIEALSNGESDPSVVKCYCKTNWFSPNVCSANSQGTFCGEDPCDSHDGNCR